MSRDYLKAANRYRPARIRPLFIAESPPAYSSEEKKSYFYFEDNPGSDILFATVVEAYYPKTGYRKADGKRKKAALLRQLQADGFWLIDAVEHPINRIEGRPCSDAQRQRIIQGSVSGLLARLNRLRDTGNLAPEDGVVIIKKVVFSVIAEPVRSAGYRLLHAAKIDFPKYYCDRDTIAGIRRALAQL